MDFQRKYNIRAIISIFLLVAGLYSCNGNASELMLVNDNDLVTIVVDENDNQTVQLAANLLADDIERITGKRPEIVTKLSKVKGNAIIIGSLETSKIIQKLNKKVGLNSDAIAGKWEVYSYQLNTEVLAKNKTALIITGSDPRGTAYGVLDLSKKMGVSPWYFWADVHPEKKKELAIEVANFTSKSPSVKFRGIFLNDEDWGLQPWAAKTLEPETGDIGPKTYAHIFELLLRLKANLIWPAMHPCTHGFFTYPGNIKVAEKYGITIGSSHCEQMLCNNVDEWKKDEFGPFNYFTNKNTLVDYWANRIKESKNINGIYTLGIRGVHDSGIVGAKNMEEKIQATNEVIQLQRNLLDSLTGKDVTKIPQVLIPYKEVLDIYDRGLDLPDDITLVWTDDNYGYIRRLSNQNERKRSGGSGIYYHASYWGRPHDYLWLSSANPWVMYEEMYKAYRYNARNQWILNVGDIKPLERDIDMFMDMAWNIEPYQKISAVKNHMNQWYSDIFGEVTGKAVTDIMQQYYQLALERRPEFMGWSQTERRDQSVHMSDYNPFANNDETQKRVSNFLKLEAEVSTFYHNLPKNDKRKDAFFQLVYYPVVMASELNKKFLYRDKAELYKKQDRASANEYARKSAQTLEKIQDETGYFNETLSGGKWNHIISFKPRNLSVFKPLKIDTVAIPKTKEWDISTEMGHIETTETHTLPVFYPWYNGSYFFDIYMKGTENIDWNISANVPWLIVSKTEGKLTNKDGNREVRIWVKINWNKIFEADISEGELTISANNTSKQIKALAHNFNHPDLTALHVPIENNSVISIYAENFFGVNNTPNSKWIKMDNLGHTGAAMQHITNDEVALKKQENSSKKAQLSYNFIVVTPEEKQLTLFALPTHPIHQNWRVGVKVYIDGKELGIADVTTKGRSETWKQNVLSNTATATVNLGNLASGKHQITIEANDPEFILDRLLITGKQVQPKVYSVIPEVRLP